MNYIAVQLGSPFYRQWHMSLVFGGLEMLLSQLPSLERVWWVSLVGECSLSRGSPNPVPPSLPAQLAR